MVPAPPVCGVCCVSALNHEVAVGEPGINGGIDVSSLALIVFGCVMGEGVGMSHE